MDSLELATTGKETIEYIGALHDAKILRRQKVLITQDMAHLVFTVAGEGEPRNVMLTGKNVADTCKQVRQYVHEAVSHLFN